MKKMLTEKDVLKAVKSALNLKRDIDLNAKMSEVEEWDSLGHLAILSSPDKTFNGKVAGIAEMASVDSIDAIIKILKAKALL